MRTRGLILLFATVTVWIVVFFLARQYEHLQKSVGLWTEAPPPRVNVGPAQAVIIATLAALCILGFDLILWIRRRHDRRN
jgi:uncharacterized membrane protein YhaH (DUF805 family)